MGDSCDMCIFINEGQNIFVNDLLVRLGYAKVATYPPDVKHKDQFLEAQQEAQQQNRGLWAKCFVK